MNAYLRSAVMNAIKKSSKKKKTDALTDLKAKLLLVEKVRGLLTIVDETIGEKPGVASSYMQKHNLKVVDSWRPFVNKHFDEVVDLVDHSSQPMDRRISDEEEEEEEDDDVVVKKDKEVIRTICVPIKKVLRNDLSEEFVEFFYQKMNKTQVLVTNLYQDLAAATTAIALWVPTIEPSSSSENELQKIIPTMFKKHATEKICQSVKWDEVLKNSSLALQFSDLFTYSHIQNIVSANFGSQGVQAQTAKKYPLWQKANTELRNSHFNFAPSGLSSSVMSDVCTKLTTNIKNMWTGNKKRTKALDNILDILLCLNLRPTAELARIAKAMQGQVKRKEAVLPSMTKNRQRNNLKKQKLLIERLSKKMQTGKEDTLALQRQIENCHKRIEKYQAIPSKKKKKVFSSFIVSVF